MKGLQLTRKTKGKHIIAILCCLALRSIDLVRRIKMVIPHVEQHYSETC